MNDYLETEEILTYPLSPAPAASIIGFYHLHH